MRRMNSSEKLSDTNQNWSKKRIRHSLQKDEERIKKKKNSTVIILINKGYFNDAKLIYNMI